VLRLECLTSPVNSKEYWIYRKNVNLSGVKIES